MILACDFDGVIHDHKNPVSGRKMGLPIDGAKRALTKYKLRGWHIYIFSSWAHERGQKVIGDWLRYYGIPYDAIGNTKINADIYLDDKAVKFTTWPDFEALYP